MPMVIPPGFASAGLELVLAGDPDPQYVTFGLDISDAGGDLNVVRDKVSAAAVDLASVLNADYTMTAVTLRVGQDGGEPASYRLPFVTPVEGTDDAPALPQNSAYLIHKQSALGGRRGRGRMYQPGVAEGVVSNTGTLSNAIVAAVSTAWAGFFAFMASFEADPPVPSIPVVLLHGTGLTATPPPSAIIGVSCDPVIATQRRRLRK